ncbi:MAG: hypothetical protein H0W76_24750 [Pyrinomonadaceae bacterium]|nr:hypothetical protein [Pyrinomonadaceae bacterium]
MRRFIISGVRTSLSLTAVFAFLAFTPGPRSLAPSPLCHAQEVIDRMVAVVNGQQLITYTDLLWQLALQPDTPLDNPRSDDLNRALRTIVDQRLIAQEAEKLPSITPTDEAVEAELNELIRRFPSRAEFYQRLALVGLGQDSEQLREIIRQRVAISNYLDFRFRSFTVVTPREVEDYYRDVYAPRARRDQPGQIVPTLEEARANIERDLREGKITSDTEEFLEDARSRADIIYLIDL